ncbi:MAG: YfhO family protein [Flavobacteriaceae bacterium]
MKSFLIRISMAVLGFGFLSLLFYYPLLSGKTLIQSDIRQYEGMARQLKEHRAQEGQETYWIDNAFGGMPTYQVGAKYPADFLAPIYSFFRLLPRPAHILFLYLMGAYILLLILKIPWRTALFGALAFGFSTYLLIILQVGHNTKALAVAFFPWVLGGLLLLFQKRWFWGFLLTTLALGMQVRANHYQMTYYLLMLLGVFVCVMGYQAIVLKNGKSFFQSVGLLIASGILAIGFNATPILATAEYTDFSTRGKSELRLQADGSPKEPSSGLDYDYITEYSYGIFESLNLIVPRIQGGGSSENLGTDHGVYDFLRARGVNPSQAEQFSENVPTYWGSQPILEAPAYIGITVFFFALLALFYVHTPFKNALAIGVLFSLMLSWGKNFAPLTQFFIDYFPLYNKFRAVSSIQVVLECCLPLLASLGVHWAFDSQNKFELKKFIKIASLPIALLLIVYFLKGTFSFSGLNDAYFKSIYGNELVTQIIEARKSIFQADIYRAILFCLVSTGLVLAFRYNKLKKETAVLILIGVLLIDLLGISNRYIDRSSSFVTPRMAETPFKMTDADRAVLQDTTRYRVYEPQLGLTGARTAYFHNTIGGYHGAKPRRLEELFDYYSTHQITGVLDMLNIKYILFPEEESGILKPMFNPNSLGVGWFIEDLVSVSSADELLERMKTMNFNQEAVFIKGSIPEKITKKYSRDSLSTLNLTQARPDQLTYTVKNTSDQFVVFSEMYYPKGWTARIDGQEAPIYNVNYVLRGLQIPAGAKVIEFSFEPDLIKNGTRIRWTAFILFIGVLALMLFAQFKRSKNES